MREHRLKTWPEPYQATADDRKLFEIRYDDRGFAVGDVLVLQEWDPTPAVYLANGYTGRWQKVRVTYLLCGKFGLPPDVVAMGIERICADDAMSHHHFDGGGAHQGGRDGC